MHKYPYYIPQKGVYKPWIPVRLGFKKTHKMTSNLTALIDSGADVCFCSKEIASLLGVTSKNKAIKDFTAANNTTFPTFPEILTLYVGGKNYETTFYISEKLPQNSPIILGQKGFFDHHKISFDVINEEIEIIYNSDN